MDRRVFVGAVAGTALSGCLGVLSGGGVDPVAKLDEAGSKIVQAHDAFYQQRPTFAPELGQVDFDERRVLDPLDDAGQAIDAAEEAATADGTRRKVEELRTLLGGVRTFATSIPDFESVLNDYLAVSSRFLDGEYDAVRSTVEGTRPGATSVAETFATARSTVDGVSGDALTEGDPFPDSDEGVLIDSWRTSADLLHDYAKSVEKGLTAYEDLVGALADLRATRDAIEDGNPETAASNLDAASSGLPRADAAASDAATGVVPTMYTRQFDPVVCVTDAGMEAWQGPLERAQAALADGDYSRAGSEVESAVSTIEHASCG